MRPVMWLSCKFDIMVLLASVRGPAQPTQQTPLVLVVRSCCYRKDGRVIHGFGYLRPRDRVIKICPCIFLLINSYEYLTY